MDIEQLYRDFNVPYVTEGHRHASPGWVHTHCPFCEGSVDYHFGFDTYDKKFMCWRCGWHAPNKSIAAVLRLDNREANKILRDYGAITPKAPQIRRNAKLKGFKLPRNSEALKKNHIQYLENRNFDAQKLIKKFGLLGTGPAGILDHLNYKHRIIIPFYWGGEIVTFDSRDITGRALNKYQACPTDRELVPHKNILYGVPSKWKETGICVEGPSDVWRMGVNSFAVSGIKYKAAQVREIAKRFKRVPVIFDDEPQAIIQANKLVADLKFRGVDAFRVDIKGDPGGLSDKEAKYLLKQLL